MQKNLIQFSFYLSQTKSITIVLEFLSRLLLKLICWIALGTSCTVFYLLESSKISFDEKIFQELAIYYKDTLNKAGYTDKLAYHASSASNQENKKKPPTERDMV